MKIRLDFVTNSSSSSFILGKPGECKLTKESAREYISNLKNELYAEYIIDLKYDSKIEYTESEIDFVREVIFWYVYDDNFDTDIEKLGDGTYDEEYGVWWRINSEYEYEECDDNLWLPDIDKRFNQEVAKELLDFAHKYFGEILVGNNYMEFYNYEAYEEIEADKNIKFKCNHMG